MRASHRSRTSRQLYGNAFRWAESVERCSSATGLFQLALINFVLGLLDIEFSSLYIECMTKTVKPVPDDAPMTMTLDERSTWSYGILVPLSTAAYFGVVLPQLSETAPAQIEWQVPMLIAIGVVIGGTIVGTILSAIFSAVRSRGVDTEFGSDIRDKEIDRHGQRTTEIITGLGLGAVIVLAMLDLDTLWIGSAALAIGAIGATWGALVKIRLYRQSRS